VSKIDPIHDANTSTQGTSETLLEEIQLQRISAGSLHIAILLAQAHSTAGT
jgi:hypothetical protein